MIVLISCPILGMIRSNPAHRRPNDLFMINLKMKLHLPLFPRTNCPQYVCGKTMDVHDMHAFCCRRVSKMVMHNRIRDYTAPILCKVLKTAGIISTSSLMEIEPKRVVPELPGLCPVDSAFRPVPSLQLTTLAPVPYTCIGFDFTIISLKGRVPHSGSSAATRKQSSSVVKHLIDKERFKFMREGKADPYNHSSLTVEEIIESLLVRWCLSQLRLVHMEPGNPCYINYFLAQRARSHIDSQLHTPTPPVCISVLCLTRVQLASFHWLRLLGKRTNPNINISMDILIHVQPRESIYCNRLGWSYIIQSRCMCGIQNREH